MAKPVNSIKKPKDILLEEHNSESTVMKLNVIMDMNETFHIPLEGTENINVSSKIYTTILNKLKDFDGKLIQEITKSAVSLEGTKNYEPLLFHLVMEVLSRTLPKLNFYKFNTAFYDNSTEVPQYLLYSSLEKSKSIYINFVDEAATPECLKIEEKKLNILTNNAFVSPFYLLNLFRKYNFYYGSEMMKMRREIEKEVLKRHKLIPVTKSGRESFVEKIRNATRELDQLNKPINKSSVSKKMNMAHTTFHEYCAQKKYHIKYDKTKKRFIDGQTDEIIC